jgi:sugar phosphate isomerase/epimerase
MLAMNTDFHGVSKELKKRRETLEKIAKAGFSHVHWTHEWTGGYFYSASEMLQIRKWSDELKLRVKGVHASDGNELKDYLSFDEYNRIAGVELIKNRIDLALILEAGSIVLHFPQCHEPSGIMVDKDEFREKYYGQAFKSFDELEPYTRIRNIRICVENLSDSTDYMFETLYKRYDPSYMGLCFDTGHSNFSCKDDTLKYARKYKERLFMMHIHDNHGEKDDHLIPYEGNFNWEGFAKTVACSAFDLPLVIESSMREYKENIEEEEYLRRAYKAGMKFSNAVENVKKSQKTGIS